MIQPLTRAALGLLMFASLCLAACATKGVIPVQVVTVDRPVAVSCIPADSPNAPAYPDTPAALKAAPDLGVWAGLMAAGWGERVARTAYLEALRADCIAASK